MYRMLTYSVAFLYPKKFVVASRLLALEHDVAAQASTLDYISKVLPYIDAILLSMDLHLVHGVIINQVLKEVLHECACQIEL